MSRHSSRLLAFHRFKAELVNMESIIIWFVLVFHVRTPERTHRRAWDVLFTSEYLQKVGGFQGRYDNICTFRAPMKSMVPGSSCYR